MLICNWKLFQEIIIFHSVFRQRIRRLKCQRKENEKKILGESLQATGIKLFTFHVYLSDKEMNPWILKLDCSKNEILFFTNVESREAWPTFPRILRPYKMHQDMALSAVCAFKSAVTVLILLDSVWSGEIWEWLFKHCKWLFALLLRWRKSHVLLMTDTFFRALSF